MDADAESKLSNRRRHYTYCHTVGGTTCASPLTLWVRSVVASEENMTPVASLSQCTHVLFHPPSVRRQYVMLIPLSLSCLRL